MKKILLISLIFSVFTVYAQQDTSSVEAQALDSIPTKDYCPHRIMLRLGTAYSNTIYKRIPENIQKYAVANVFEMSYAYFFTPNFGLGGGIGLSHIDAK